MNIVNLFLRAGNICAIIAAAYLYGGKRAALAALAAWVATEAFKPASAFREIGSWLYGILAGLGALWLLNWRRALPLLKKLGIAGLVVGAIWLLWKTWQNVSVPKLSRPDWHWPSWSLPSLSVPSSLLIPGAILVTLLALAAAIYFLLKRWKAQPLNAAPSAPINWSRLKPLAALLALLALIALVVSMCDGNGKKVVVRAPAPAASVPVVAKPAIVAPATKQEPKVTAYTVKNGDGCIRVMRELLDEEWTVAHCVALSKELGNKVHYRHNGKWTVAWMFQAGDVVKSTEGADGNVVITVKYATRHKH